MKLAIPQLRATAFLTRSIRQESRLFSQHLLRGALAAVVLLLFLMQLTTSSLFGAAGSRFASSIVTAFYWFLTLVGLLHYSVAITEEKEEETLPLLRMTGVSNMALLIGKSVPRLAVAVLFLLVVAPFLVLSITMGGLVPEQILSCVLGLLSYAFLLSQLGLLASTLASDSRRAFTLSIVLWFAWELGHYLVQLASFTLRLYGLSPLAELASTCQSWLYERALYVHLGAYLNADRGDPIWFPQMTWHVLSGCGCLGLSWLLFDVCNSRAIAQGAAAKSAGPTWRRAQRRRQSAPASGNALIWKSSHFLLGGRKWLLVRLIGQPTLAIAAVVLIATLVQEWPEAIVFAIALMVVATAVLLVDLARNLGRVLNEEVFQQTLVSLKMLPITTPQLLLPLISGVLPVVFPPMACFGLGMLLLIIAEPRDAEDFLEVWLEPWFWHLFSWAALTLHLGVLLSLYMRYGGMILATAALWIAAPMLLITFIATIAFMLPSLDRAAEDFMQYVVPLLLILLELGLCWGLQRMIVRRVDQVAEQ